MILNLYGEHASGLMTNCLPSIYCETRTPTSTTWTQIQEF